MCFPCENRATLSVSTLRAPHSVLSSPACSMSALARSLCQVDFCSPKPHLFSLFPSLEHDLPAPPFLFTAVDARAKNEVVEGKHDPSQR